MVATGAVGAAHAYLLDALACLEPEATYGAEHEIEQEKGSEQYLEATFAADTVGCLCIIDNALVWHGRQHVEVIGLESCIAPRAEFGKEIVHVDAVAQTQHYIQRIQRLIFIIIRFIVIELHRIRAIHAMGTRSLDYSAHGTPNGVSAVFKLPCVENDTLAYGILTGPV